jgi:hypothetical protein
MSKVTISNSFHGTDYTTTIKDSYFGSDDIMTELDIQAACNHDAYAIKKIREIEKALCPHQGKSCSCKCANASN